MAVPARCDEAHEIAVVPYGLKPAGIGIIALHFQCHDAAGRAIAVTLGHRGVATDEIGLAPGYPAIHAGFRCGIALGKFRVPYAEALF